MTFSETQKDAMLKVAVIIGLMGVSFYLEVENDKNLIKNNATALGHINSINNYSRSSIIVIWYSYIIDNNKYEGHSTIDVNNAYKREVKKLLENKDMPIAYDQQTRAISNMPLLKSDFEKYRLGRDITFLNIYTSLDSLATLGK